MVDFKKLRSEKVKSKPINPIEIFRRSPKPDGVIDLFSSQTEILNAWFERRNERDTVLKLHTGGGKTFVGLLIARSTLNETNEPVLYLTPTTQLVQQTLETAKKMGIPAVPYVSGKPLNEEFENGTAIMVGTYKSLFNGKSKFGIRGDAGPKKVGAIILDDAHASFSVVRESFTLEIKSNGKGKNYERYLELANLFRKAFNEIDKLGTLEDVIEGNEYAVLEVPYWAWHEQLDAVREQLKADSEQYALVWPLIRDRLHMCHAFISRNSFTITPILPFVHLFPTFHEAPRRIYMSATIADDSEIVRTFDADSNSLKQVLQSESLAGVSERMTLIPDLMPVKFDQTDLNKLIKWVAQNKQLGTVVLAPSDEAAKQWSDVATVARGSEEVEALVDQLRKQEIRGPIVFSNRYDGIDLPGDSCRVLVMSGLPSGTSNYELFRASALYGGTTLTRMLAQRIEQGMGRGARGAGDHCVVLLVGSDISAWVAKEANFKYLTSSTRAQLDMGITISKAIESLSDLASTIQKSFNRDQEWTEYHAETLAELVDEENSKEIYFNLATVERKAINLWEDGYCDLAITKLQQVVDKKDKELDSQMQGWFEQLAARISDRWGNTERAQDLQRQAFSHNRNLLRPKILPPYRPLSISGAQAKGIAENIGGYRLRQGYLQIFENVAIKLNQQSTANQFEQALCEFAKMIGLNAERHDNQGEGPDVLWLLPEKVGFVIEAKSRKKGENPLTKEEHGQLLVAAEWFSEKYPEYECVKISVHPKNRATRAAIAGASHALTFEKLAAMVSDARSLLTSLCESQLSVTELEVECARLLEKSDLRADKIASRYLMPFEVQS